MKPKSLPLRVAFTGYYGMSNFGDDLFGHVCLQSASRYWPRTKALLVHPTSGNQVFRHGGALGKAARISSALAATLYCDVVVLGGGSVISSQRSRGRTLQYALARVIGTRFAGVGVSIGPFDSRSDEDKAAELLRNFIFLSVRDSCSWEIASKMDLGYAPAMAGDLAGLYNAPDVPRDAGVIGFAPCNFAHSDNSNLKKERDRVHMALVETLGRTALRHGLKIRLLALNNHPLLGDDAMVAEAAERFRAIGVETQSLRAADLGIEGTWDAMAACRGMVSARLHGAIPAYLAGVPFLLYEYHRKCSDFLDDIGQPDDLRLRRGLVTPDELSTVIERLLGCADAPALAPAAYRERAVAGFRAAPWASSS